MTVALNSSRLSDHFGAGPGAGFGSRPVRSSGSGASDIELTPSGRSVRRRGSLHPRWVFARSPEVVVRLHVEPHLGAGARCALEAQRHRCADAGTPVQQRGQSLPAFSTPSVDLGSGYHPRTVRGHRWSTRGLSGSGWVARPGGAAAGNWRFGKPAIWRVARLPFIPARAATDRISAPRMRLARNRSPGPAR